MTDLHRAWSRVSLAVTALAEYGAIVAAAERNLSDAVRYRDETVRDDRARGYALWSRSECMTFAAGWQRRVEVLTRELGRMERLREDAHARLLDAVREYGRAMVAAECERVAA